jgi:hypothetical protein
MQRLKSSDRSIHHVTNLSVHARRSRTPPCRDLLARPAARAGRQAARCKEVFMSGRYVDRFEKRGDAWRIAARTVDVRLAAPAGQPPRAPSASAWARGCPMVQNHPHDPVYALFAALGRNEAVPAPSVHSAWLRRRLPPSSPLHA